MTTGIVTVAAATGAASTDTANLNTAFTNAGVGGVILVPPNSNYAINATVTMLSGQKLVGNDSTFTRAAMRYTTTTGGSVTAGTTLTFSVVDGSQLATGDKLVIADETSGSKYNYTASKGCTISGNTVTAPQAFTVGLASNSAINEDPFAGGAATATASNYAFPSGSKVCVVYPLLIVATGCTVVGLKIDGNKSGQQVGHWDLYSEVLVYGTTLNDIMLERVEVTNYASDGLLESGANPAPYAVAPDYGGLISSDKTVSSVNSMYRNCRFTDGAGNGIHLSNISFAKVLDCFFYNLNSDYGVGHWGGAVTFSSTGQGVEIRNCYMEKCYAGVGDLYQNNHSKVSVIGNKMVGCYCFAIITHGSSTGNGFHNLLVADNKFVYCGKLWLEGYQTSAVLPSEVTVRDNTFIGTRLTIQSVKNVICHDNVFQNDIFTPLKCSAGAVTAADTTLTLASTSSFVVNQVIYASLNGVRSPDVRVTAKTSTVLTLSRAIGVAFATAPWVYDAIKMPYTEVVDGTTITASSTTVWNVNDATAFSVGMYASIYSLTNDNATTNPSRITAVDKASSPNTITTFTASTQSWSGAGQKIQVYPGTSYPPGQATIESLYSAPIIRGNVVSGGYDGINVYQNDLTTLPGANVSGNQISGYQRFGIRMYAAQNSIQDNVILGDTTGFSKSWAQGISSNGTDFVVNNVIQTGGTSQVCIGMAGAHAVASNNLLRSKAGSSAGGSISATGTYCDINNNYVTVAMTGTAVARTTTENVETGTVTMV